MTGLGEDRTLGRCARMVATPNEAEIAVMG
jgi:hypothetical protein